MFLSKINPKSKNNFYLFILGVLLLFKSPFDPDMWWHIKYGRIILETGHFPLYDSFSYAFSGYRWASSYWIPQVSQAILSGIGGFALMSLVYSIVFSVLLIWLLNKVQEKYSLGFFEQALVLTIVCVGFSSFGVTVRPMFFSGIFMFLLWHIFSLPRKSVLQNAIIPVIFLLWANMHADFMVGFGVLLAAQFFDFVEGIRSKASLKKLVLPVILVVTSFLATFINPYGAELHKTLLNDVVNIKNQNGKITEFMPASLDQVPFWFYLALVTLVLVVGVKHRFLPAPKKLTGLAVVTTILLGFVSGYFFRFLFVFAFDYICIFSKSLGNFLASLKLKPFIKAFSISIFWIMLILIFLTNFVKAVDISALSADRKLPYYAMLFVKSAKPKGNMLNFYNWGGFLIEYLPEYKVFTDGRMASWYINNEWVLNKYYDLTVKKDPEKLNAFINQYDVGWSIFPNESTINAYLQNELGWKLVYKDSVATVLINPSIE